MTGRGIVCEACMLLLAASACGEGTNRTGAAGPGPGAAGSSATDSASGGETSQQTGGSGGTPGDAGGIGGQGGASSGGTATQGAMDAGETLNLPPRPEWNPMLPLGEPGWRQSTISFCSQELGLLDPRVWSKADSVYVLIHQACNVFSAGYPCTVYAGEALYRNDGSGWTRVYGINGDNSAFATGLTGLSTGTVALLGREDVCPVNLIDPAGNPRCVWSEPAWIPDAASVDDRLYVLFWAGSSGPQVVREYDGQGWRDLATVPTQERAFSIAANGDTVAVSGTNLILAGSANASTLAAIPNVPAGDYGSVWVYDARNIVLGNGVGHLVRYDGAGWTVIDTGTADSIAEMWGAPDGTVYFITQSQFGRLVGGQVEMFTVPEALNASHYFADLWGNTSSEVFVAVNDRDFGIYDCGATFLLWFDGAVFHQF